MLQLFFNIILHALANEVLEKLEAENIEVLWLYTCIVCLFVWINWKIVSNNTELSKVAEYQFIM